MAYWLTGLLLQGICVCVCVFVCSLTAFPPQGMDTVDGKIQLISSVIESLLDIDMSVLMGANIAMNVAQEDFCESTIGCKSAEQGAVLKQLFHRPHFHINVVSDIAAVELCVVYFRTLSQWLQDFLMDWGKVVAECAMHRISASGRVRKGEV